MTTYTRYLPSGIFLHDIRFATSLFKDESLTQTDGESRTAVERSALSRRTVFLSLKNDSTNIASAQKAHQLGGTILASKFKFMGLSNKTSQYPITFLNLINSHDSPIKVVVSEYLPLTVRCGQEKQEFIFDGSNIIQRIEALERSTTDVSKKAAYLEFDISNQNDQFVVNLNIEVRSQKLKSQFLRPFTHLLSSLKPHSSMEESGTTRS